MGRIAGQKHYTEAQKQEITAELMRRVAAGIPLTKAVVGLVNYRTFWFWFADDVRIQEALAQARLLGVEAGLEELQKIADDKTIDPAHKKHMIYARELRARMLAPRKYGPRLDLTSGGERLQMDDVGMAIRAASIINDALKRIEHKPADDDEE